MAALPDGGVDAVITSPPYNLGIRYSRYDDALPRDRYLEWTEEWALAVRRVLSEAGSLFLNVGGKPTDPWVPFDVAAVFRRHFTLQNTFHWVKSIALDPEDGRADEPLCVATTSRSRAPLRERLPRVYLPLHPDGSSAPGSAGDRRAVSTSNVTAGPRPARTGAAAATPGSSPTRRSQSRHRDRPHPATFPTRLPEMCLRLHGRERIRLAMDPFLGLGSGGGLPSRPLLHRL